MRTYYYVGSLCEGERGGGARHWQCVVLLFLLLHFPLPISSSVHYYYYWCHLREERSSAVEERKRERRELLDLHFKEGRKEEMEVAQQ